MLLLSNRSLQKRKCKCGSTHATGTLTTIVKTALRCFCRFANLKQSYPDHLEISSKSPGGALEFDGNRNDQTVVSRLLSGHLKDMTFESGRKVFQTCSKCHLLPASPEHILDCLGIALEDVHASPILVLDFARVNGLMNL
ncbi:uncharacterized protein TNCV_604331 [Trichonephila clavipes]|nr:uncharacterized protein TNCV_604331 [Trichonephila clavipes]